MEYEFLRNSMTGTFLARFSMEHAILGLWFSEELGDDKDFYVEIGQTIAQLQANQIANKVFVGKGLSIELDNEQVRVFANEIDMEQDIDNDSGFSLYDSESEAFCGLEDFNEVLLSWRRFIDEKH
ncbi:YacL family protein [uncultured Shewanella sp.]|uniref:YacL family protein n=1 Tax=uncultured Shewanella sp. TaxID=173975 RepID=UPI002618E129|nr:YacL family protein [uncultured Shewanella sp.]